MSIWFKTGKRHIEYYLRNYNSGNPVEVALPLLPLLLLLSTTISTPQFLLILDDPLGFLLTFFVQKVVGGAGDSLADWSLLS